MTTLWLELQGVHAFSINNEKAAKSISRSRSFNKNKTSQKKFLLSQILIHFETVYAWLIDENTEIQEVGIMLRDEDFIIHRVHSSFPEYTNHRKKMLHVVKSLFESLYIPQKVYRSTGIHFYKLRSHVPRQLNLFENDVKKRDNSYKLSQTVNRLNKKYGRQKLSF